MSVLRLKGSAAATVAVLALAGSGALAGTPATAGTVTAARPAMTLPVPVTPEPETFAPEPSAPQAPAPGAPAPEAFVAQPKGKVVSRLPLSIREKPRTGSGYLGALQPGTVIALTCKVVGQNVDGNNLWYLLGGGRAGYVAARYVENLSPVPYCPR